MQIWNWNLMLTIELKLLFGDAEDLARLIALESPLQYFIGNIGNSIRELVCRNDFLCCGYRIFIAPLPSTIEDLATFHWEESLCHCLVVAKSGYFDREEFSPFTRLLHMLDDSSGQSFVLLLRILFVEDAVLLMPEANASKEITRFTAAIEAIEYIFTSLEYIVSANNIAYVNTHYF